MTVTELLDAKKHANIELLKRADGSSWDPEKTCLPGTRVQVINELVTFASSPTLETSERIQLITGVLGCGKSAIAHSVSQRCYDMRPRILGASFMFSREAEARRTPGLVISTIVHTLCGRYPDFARAVSAAIEEDRSILLASVSRQFRSLILEPMKITASSMDYPVVIVIDALDEGCSDGADTEFLKALANDGAELPPCMKWIITSRPLLGIMMHLENKPHILVRNLELGNSSNLVDIALFARHALASIAEKRNLGETWPGEELKHSFVRKAEGLFIWVATTCGFILTATNPTKQLERLVGGDSSLRLGTEAKMAQLYTAVLAACPWDDDEDFANNYQLLMGTVLALKAPLSPLSIKSLLALDNDISVAEALRPLSPVLMGVLEATDADGPLQILHDSFRGFLTGQSGNALSATNPRYKIDVAEHNERVTLAVVRLLNHELPRLKPDLDLIIGVINQEETQGVPRLPEGVITVPVWYCCQYLLSHLSTVLTPPAELVQAVNEFMNTGVSSWVLLCSSEGSLQGVSAIFDWYTVCNKLMGVHPIKAHSASHSQQHRKYRV